MIFVLQPSSAKKVLDMDKADKEKEAEEKENKEAAAAKALDNFGLKPDEYNNKYADLKSKESVSSRLVIFLVLLLKTWLD